MSIQPTTTIANCPHDLDVLFVPGGLGTAATMEDEELLGFLRDRAPRAKYVTSVCTGSLLLAAAGVLNGYKSTCHWAMCDALAQMGVDVVRERVVVDRNRISGGGVTAGIDFGLVLLAHLRGEQVAKLTQLIVEYDPHPPFDCGTPEKAGKELETMANGMMHDINEGMMRAAKAVGKRFALA